jgi:hypothetical protein
VIHSRRVASFQTAVAAYLVTLGPLHCAVGQAPNLGFEA